MRFDLSISPRYRDVMSIRSFAVLALLCGASACGTSSPSQSPNDAATPSDDANGDGAAADALPAEAPFSPPQIVTKGGAVLVAPHFVPVTFDADTVIRPIVDEFTAKIGATDYWHTVAAEYGVGAATSGAPIHVSDPAPTTITRDGVGAWLKTQLAAKAAGWEQPADGTAYVVFYDNDKTAVKTAETLQRCEVPYLLSSFTQDDGREVPFAIVLHCPSATDEIAGATGAASAALVDLATGPFADKPAYAAFDDDHYVWEWLADAGSYVPAHAASSCRIAAPFKPTGFDYAVQPFWSNSAARAKRGPCVPESKPFFAAYPELPDTVQFNGKTTKGIKVPVGESRTIPVVLYADGDVPAFTVSIATSAAEANVTYSLDKTSGGNGDRLMLTISRKASSPKGDWFAIATFHGKTQSWAWTAAVGE